MNLREALKSLPDTNQPVISVLSGGLDSSVMTMLLCKRYGARKVTTVSYDYGQKQRVELEKAHELSSKLGVRHHKILNLDILGDIAKPMSANIGGTSVEMPDIKDGQ